MALPFGISSEARVLTKRRGDRNVGEIADPREIAGAAGIAGVSFGNVALNSLFAHDRSAAPSRNPICRSHMAPTLSTSFDFERIAVDTVALDDAQRIENQAARYHLPHLDKFLLEIAQQFSSPDEAYGRRYQRDAIEARALKIVSPFTGEPAFSSCSIAVMRSVFYRFREGAVDYYVASATIGLGYPLSALLLPSENVLLS
jgi:hypothetical protein